MDYAEEFDKLVGQMEWRDVVDTLNDVISEMLTSNPPFSNSPSPVVPGSGFHGHHQSVDYLNVDELDNGHAAHTFGQSTIAAPHLDLPYQSTVGNLSGPSTITSSPAAPTPTVVQNLVPIQLVNGQVAFIVVEDGSNSAVPSLETSVIKKRKSKEPEDNDRPYIKKPPNAFMLFRKAQRPNVVAELNIRDSAAVNKVLGQKWKMLSKDEQAKYYEEAAKESLLHAISHPGWSTSQNYGKKRKRQRCEAPATADSTYLGHL